MKILFVEDEISQNIEIIIALFSKHIGKEGVKKLEQVEADGWGAGPDEIKSVLDDTGLVEFESNFPNALAKVISQPQNYALFIVDRNLSDVVYELEDVNRIDPDFNEWCYDRHWEREGDYLLLKLYQRKIAIKEKFYFLTANLDEIRGEKKHITDFLNYFPNFLTENFIEKSNNEALSRMVKIIENMPELNLRYENRYYLRILRQHIDKDTAEAFFNILLKIEKDRREPDIVRENLASLRIIYEAILKCCPQTIPEMLENQNCTDNGKLVLGGKTIIWLSDNHYTNNILRNFMFSIYRITSDFGSHTNETAHIFKPTTDTVNSLVYAMKDFIRWFGKTASAD